MLTPAELVAVLSELVDHVAALARGDLDGDPAEWSRRWCRAQEIVSTNAAAIDSLQLARADWQECKQRDGALSDWLLAKFATSNSAPHLIDLAGIVVDLRKSAERAAQGGRGDDKPPPPPTPTDLVTLAEWASSNGVSYSTLTSRRKHAKGKPVPKERGMSPTGAELYSAAEIADLLGQPYRRRWANGNQRDSGASSTS